MEIRTASLKDHSKEQATSIASLALANTKIFDNLIIIFFSGDAKISYRAS